MICQLITSMKIKSNGRTLTAADDDDAQILGALLERRVEDVGEPREVGPMVHGNCTVLFGCQTEVRETFALDVPSVARPTLNTAVAVVSAEQKGA